MRRKRLVLLLLASFLGAVAVALLAAQLGLPALVRWVAIRQGRSQLGRDVSIESVRLDLWNGWYSVKGLRVAGRVGESPLLEIAEVNLRVVYSYLFTGQVRAHEIAITSPVVRLARIGPNELSISDIIQRVAGQEEKKSPDAGGIEILADLVLVSNGTILFEDRAVSPPRTFELKNLTVNLRDITTKLNAGRGTGTVAFVLNGTPVAIVARDVRVRPVHLTAQLNIVDFDVDEVWAYVPFGGARVRPSGGRFSTSIDLVYDASTGLGVDVETTVADLTLVREGQIEPLLWLPAVKVALREFSARDGAIALAKLDVATNTSVVDESVSPPRRYEVRDLHLAVERLAYPSGPAATVQLSAGLPEGATLDVRGTISPAPLHANLTVALANADLALVTPYIPRASPITVDRGRLGATLAVAVTEGPVIRVDGEIVAGYFLRLRDQAQPFIEHPRVVFKITDLRWQAGAATMQRLTADGPATIVDASVSPAQRAEFTTLTLQVDDTTWPVERPVRLRSTAVLGTSGTSAFEGTFNPATLAADIRARFADLDVTRAGPYIPATVPLAITGGRMSATVALKNDPAAGLAITANGAIAGLGVSHRGDPKLSVSDRRLAFAVDDLRVKGDALAVRRARVQGAPALAEEGASPPRELALRGLQISARDVTWPARGPVPIELHVDLPESGALSVAGTADLNARVIDLKLDLRDAVLSPYQAFLPMDGPIGGTASAALGVAARMASDITATGRGQAALAGLTLGPPDQPSVRIERVETTGIAVEWPRDIRVDLVKFLRPAVVLERDRDGSFPLRAMLEPRNRPAARGPEPPAPAAEAPAAPASASGPALMVSIREILIEEGDFRFVDRSTTPAYSEEISRLALSVTNVSTAPGERATMALQAVVGATGALDLKGEIAPTADPFYLDIQGELREMPLPRSNPYFRQVFDWFLKRGAITNTLHYRIVGDQLTAENDVRIQRLGVEKDATPVASDKKIGLPLGLIVAMITDRRGDIAFSLPVSGNIKEPGFSVGSAIWAALKNVLTNVATAPFQAIGKLFGKGDDVQEFKVDPLIFPAGSATLNAEGQQHLQRVADFLRESPNLHLELRPVVSADDLASLKAAEVTARIQRVQREQKIGTFEAAARALFSGTFPGQPAPDGADAIVERLRERTPVPDSATVDLASRRLESARAALVQAGGVEADRLSSGGPVAGGPGQGRVEFELSPGG